MNAKLTKAQQKVLDIAQAQGYVSNVKGISIHTIISLSKKGYLVWVSYGKWELAVRS